MDRAYGALVLAAWCVGIAWHGSVTQTDGRADVHARFADVSTLEDRIDEARFERALLRQRARDRVVRTEAPKNGAIWIAHGEGRVPAQIWGKDWVKPFEFELDGLGFTYLAGLPAAVYSLRADGRERLVRVRAGEIAELLVPIRRLRWDWVVPPRRVLVARGQRTPTPIVVRIPRLASRGAVRLVHPGCTGRATIRKDTWTEDRTFELRGGATTRVLALPAGRYVITYAERTSKVTVEVGRHAVVQLRPKSSRRGYRGPPGGLPPGLIEPTDPVVEPSAPVWLDVLDDD